MSNILTLLSVANDDLASRSTHGALRKLCSKQWIVGLPGRQVALLLYNILNVFRFGNRYNFPSLSVIVIVYGIDLFPLTGHFRYRYR